MALKVVTTKTASTITVGDRILTSDGWADVQDVDPQGGYGQRDLIRFTVHSRNPESITQVDLWAETPVVMESEQESAVVRKARRRRQRREGQR